MTKFRKILAATIIFSGFSVGQNAIAREDFYNLGNAEPSVIINLGALDRLEQPVYAAPQPSRAYRRSAKIRHKAAPQMPVVSENTEPTPAPPPPVQPVRKSKLQHAAPPLPVVDETPAEPNLPPPPSVELVKPVANTPPAPPPLPKVPVVKNEPPPAPHLPEAPPPVEKKAVDLPPPPPLPPVKADNKKSLPPAMPSLPTPPPLPNDTSNNNNNMPRVIVSSKSIAANQQKADNKNNDNIVALPPAPPAPPAKTLVAASKDLPAPPPLPVPPGATGDMMALPPPLPVQNNVDIDKKIADEKARINAEEIKSKAAIKNTVSKMPTPKELANAAASNLPPSPSDLPPVPTPPPLDSNSLPPLPGAPVDIPSAKSSNNKASDLPPLTQVTGKDQNAVEPDVKNSAPAKETVMMQPDKIPAVSGGHGVVTMSYSEAETEIPLVEKAKLDDIISQLSADKSKTVTVIAFASGTPEQASQAKRTSLARVLAVRKYMMERNIDPDRINPRPLGNKAEGGVPDRVDMIVEKGART